jgi:phospholipase C
MRTTCSYLAIAGLAVFSSLSASSAMGTPVAPSPTTPVEHFIVVLQQNQTFDSYFGTYPGVDGLPPDVCITVDLSKDSGDCIRPFHVDRRPDLHHGRSTFRRQYNGGRMDGFVAALNERGQDGRMALGYYDDRELPYYWNLADEYVLFDRFFSSARSGSIQNRMFAVAGVPGSDKGRIPEGGYADLTTIFDRLEERGLDWRFYVRNYDPELSFRLSGDSGRLEPQVQWVPLLGIPRFLDQPDLFEKIVDLEEFFADLERDTLPAVAYVLALGATEHPPQNPTTGQRVMRSMIQGLMSSEAWSRSAFLITYDDWGGAYDHVPPPQIDEYGYGFRVPALLISPYAKRGHVDHTELDFTSILRFIEDNWLLEPLAGRDATANGLAGAFDFSAPPRMPEFVGWQRPGEQGRTEPGRSVIHVSYSAGLILAALIIGSAVRKSSGLGEREEESVNGVRGRRA